MEAANGTEGPVIPDSPLSHTGLTLLAPAGFCVRCIRGKYTQPTPVRLGLKPKLPAISLCTRKGHRRTLQDCQEYAPQSLCKFYMCFVAIRQLLCSRESPSLGAPDNDEAERTCAEQNAHPCLEVPASNEASQEKGPGETGPVGVRRSRGPREAAGWGGRTYFCSSGSMASRYGHDISIRALAKHWRGGRGREEHEG